MKRLVMGSCGFYGSRKAIFMRSQPDDSDESHLMKKKKKTNMQVWEQPVSAVGGIWRVLRGLPHGGALPRAGEQSTPVSEGQPRVAGDATSSRALSVGKRMWSHVHKKGEEEQRGSFSACTWIYLQATISDSTAAIIKWCSFLSYSGLV